MNMHVILFLNQIVYIICVLRHEMFFININPNLAV